MSKPVIEITITDGDSHWTWRYEQASRIYVEMFLDDLLAHGAESLKAGLYHSRILNSQEAPVGTE